MNKINYIHNFLSNSKKCFDHRLLIFLRLNPFSCWHHHNNLGFAMLVVNVHCVFLSANLRWRGLCMFTVLAGHTSCGQGVISRPFLRGHPGLTRRLLIGLLERHCRLTSTPMTWTINQIIPKTIFMLTIHIPFLPPIAETLKGAYKTIE